MPINASVAPSIRASGSTKADLVAGGWKGILDKLITANSALADPTTTATVSVTGGGSTGGNLPAGTRQVAYSFHDGAGETLAAGRSTTATVAAGNVPRVTLPALPTGACEIRLYSTAAGDPTGSLTLYADGITTTTFDMAYAAPTEAGISPPIVNSTGAASVVNLIRKLEKRDLTALFVQTDQIIDSYKKGDPVSFTAIRDKLSRRRYAMAIWYTALNEVLALIAANPGTLSYEILPGTGLPRLKRTI